MCIWIPSFRTPALETQQRCPRPRARTRTLLAIHMRLPLPLGAVAAPSHRRHGEVCLSLRGDKAFSGHPAGLSNLLPGSPAEWSDGEEKAGSWPRYLFLFRASLGDLRLAEVRSVAAMLGCDGGRIAPTAQGSAPKQLPVVESIGGDRGPSIFQYVSMPDEAAAVAVARRCVMVRGVFEVWADLECDEEGMPIWLEPRTSSSVCQSLPLTRSSPMSGQRR